jgi:hypothetical protein
MNKGMALMPSPPILETLRLIQVKERQGATLVDSEPARFVGGPGLRQIWRLDREAWVARRSR